jgi:hypothetical protein
MATRLYFEQVFSETSKLILNAFLILGIYTTRMASLAFFPFMSYKHNPSKNQSKLHTKTTEIVLHKDLNYYYS